MGHESGGVSALFGADTDTTGDVASSMSTMTKLLLGQVLGVERLWLEIVVRHCHVMPLFELQRSAVAMVAK